MTEQPTNRAVRRLALMAALVLGLLVPIGPAGAGDALDTEYGSTSVPPTVTPSSGVSPDTGTAPASTTGDSTLPVTGGDLLGLLVIGAMLAGGGTLLVVSFRRPERATSGADANARR